MTATPEALQQLFPLFDGIDMPPQFNVAPSQGVLAVRQRPEGGKLEALRLRWGLIPSWADDPKIGNRLINARVETVAEKPSFRSAFKQRHCLILADGFYEWQKQGKAKQAYHIRLADGRPFAFAGLWERWTKGDEPVESCTVLTTAASPVLRSIHDRMPLILDARDHATWLDAAASHGDLAKILHPLAPDALTAIPVGAHVNSPHNKDATCLTPATLF